MVDKVQSKSQIAEKYVFHFGLIKLLVLEEMKKKNRDWNTFLFLENYDLEVVPTPSKRVSSTTKPKEIHATSSKKRKGQKDTKKTQELGKGKEKQRDEHEGETTFDQEVPDDDVQIIEDTTDKRQRKKFKGKKLQFVPDVVENPILRKPITRSTTRKLAMAREDVSQPSSSKSEPKKIEETRNIIHHKEKVTEQPEELKAQLQQAQETISKLYKENRQMRITLSYHMYLCQDVLLKAKIMAKKTLPLHGQVKNIYMLNRELQA